MILTARDKAIIQKLSAYGVLSTEQVGRMFFSNIAITTVRRRLRILESMKYIYRVDGLDSGGVAWALTKRTAETSGCLYPARLFNRNTLKHDVALSEVRNVLESVGIGNQWMPEHVLKTQSIHKLRTKNDERFVPDAIFSVQQKQESKVVALELELHGKHKKRYENILTRYKHKSKLWSVWYLVPNESLGKKLESVWNEINYGKRNDLLMWSKLDELLYDPWNIIVHSEHFSHFLRELIAMKKPETNRALATALSESTSNVKPLTQPTELILENHK